jgi:hypothetical protein
MTVGNYTEVLGTPEGDTLTGLDLEIVYSLAGDDLLSPAEEVLGVNSPTPPIFVGGTGADEYTALSDSVLWILDTGNSPGDVLEASGISLSGSTFAEIAGQHLFMVDVNSRQSIYIFDWQESASQIETFEFSDGTVDYDFLVDELTSRGEDGFSDFAWSDPGVAPDERTGLSANTIESAIDDLLDRAQELEGIVGENPNLDLDGDGRLLPTVDGILAQRFIGGGRGDALIAGLPLENLGGERQTAVAIEGFLENAEFLDVDEDGRLLPTVDGILAQRFIGGGRGDALIAGLPLENLGGERQTAQLVTDFLNDFIPVA